MALSDFFSRGFRHAARYRKIIGVLTKYGFDDFLSSIRIQKYLPGSKHFFSKKRYEDIVHLSRWERMRMVLEELGPSFVKLGQTASNRPDLLPLPLIKELEKLQDKAPPFPVAEVKKIIEEELNTSIDTNFNDFDETPLASASIAQVHTATLKDGEKVVLKVQRPNIENEINTDIEIMYSLAGLMEHYSNELSYYDPVKVVEVFETTIYQEMDFLHEAANLERFSNNFEGDKTIRIPEVYNKLSTENVLTMGRVDGKKVSELYEDTDSQEYDNKLLANRILHHFFKQVFMHGFFHADPHPGNIFILKDNVVCYIDFGMMGVITPRAREEMTNIFIGVQMKDTRRIVQALRKLSTESRIENIPKLEERLSKMIEDYSHKSLDSIRIADTVNEIRKLVIDFKIHVPPDFFLLLKANVALEGMVLKLDPELKPIEHLKPYVKHIFRQRLRPGNLSKKIYLSLMDIGSFIQDIPMDIKEVLDRIKAGKVNVELEHSGVEPLTNAIEHVSNRIAVSIVLAALIMGSSLLVLADIPPRYWEIPVFGLAGYLIAAILGFWLIISILRKGEM